MKTIIDDSHTLFLDKIEYSSNDKMLNIFVLEGIKTEVAEPLELPGGITLDNSYALKTTIESRKYLIKFEDPVTWQTVDESFTTFNEDEKRDSDGFIQIIKNSEYFKYVTQNHGWYEENIGKGTHIRVWTENEVIDVVCCSEPVITEIN